MSDNGLQHDIRKLSQHEIDALADRLFNRAISMLAVDTLRSMQTDTLLAVALLRVVARDCSDDGVDVRVFKGGQE